jgi:3,4-dihydroxy 2-butanone 4-phosphate synthase
MSESSLEEFGKDYSVRVNNALEQLRLGKGVLLLDAANRENEGDLIYAAENMSVSDMALMIRECSRIVCLCLTPEKIESLGLCMMVENNTSKNSTAFTISIEAKKGVSTGVSAVDRIQTIRTAIAANAKPDDLAHPGHVFPLVAKPNGVLERAGHTEGSIDLVKLAGLGDSAVLCELMNYDGTMARLDETIAFAQKNNMPVVTINDLIQYRKNNEPIC